MLLCCHFRFLHRKAKIKFPMIKTDQMKAKDRSEAESVVNEDRKHAIEAAIVRTMKMRKVMMHNQLVLEVINQLVSRHISRESSPHEPL